jgi:Tfp pilus assembly protein PilV
MRRPSSLRRTLSLLEVVFALAVLAVALLGLAATLGATQHTVSSTTEHQAASREAFRHLDLVMATPFGSTADVWDGATFPVEGPGGVDLPASSSLQAKGMTRAGRVDISVDPDGDGSTSLLEARVTVSWKDVTGLDRCVEVVCRRTG